MPAVPIAITMRSSLRATVLTPGSDRMDTPASLLERLRQPSQEQAWARLVELYTPLLFRWARRAGLQTQDAADLVQERLCHPRA